MERTKVLLYINCIDKDEIDKKEFEVLESYCERKGYEPVMSFEENTDLTGMSHPVKFMCVGLGATHTIDRVITMCSGMVGKDINSVLKALEMMENQGVFVETVADDLDEFYELLYSDGVSECSCSDEDSAFMEFVKNVFANK